MKKLSLDERLNRMKPSDTPLLWIGYTLLFMMLLIPMGCSHVEVLPGLCYTDKLEHFYVLNQKKISDLTQLEI